jgi:serine/threonine-protein kinase
VAVTRNTKPLGSGSPADHTSTDGEITALCAADTAAPLGDDLEQMTHRVRAPVDVTQARRCPRCGAQYTSLLRFCPFDGEAVMTSSWNPSIDPLLDKVLAGRYRVEQVLAEGGMGTVYEVRHTRLENLFALKVLRRELAEDPGVAARLIEEAKATAAIGHPNIVAVTDFGEVDATLVPELGELRLPYFVMELVGGASLGDLLRKERRLPSERVAAIMLECADALGAAHRAGIIHRDLKPDNVRVLEGERGELIVKVLDFGVAKVMGSSRVTVSGIVFGTPQYMSPEQARGEPVDARSDVYAMGVLMYQCLTGAVPFEDDSFMGVVSKHLFMHPDPVSHTTPGLLGHPLEAVVMRCLAKDPAQRYGSMAELAGALEPCCRSPRARAPSSAALERASDPGPGTIEQALELPGLDRRRSTRRILVGVAVGGLLIGSAVALGLVGRSAEHAAPPSGPSGTLPSPAALGIEPPVPPPGASAPARGEEASAETPIEPMGATEGARKEPKRLSEPRPAPGAPSPRASAPVAAGPSAKASARPRKSSGDVVDPWGR